MSLNIKVFLIIISLLPFANSNAQFTNSETKNIGAKQKTKITSSRHDDLVKYTNQVFIVDNAIKAYDKKKAIESVKILLKLSETEIARTENNLIDLYNIKPQTEEVRMLTSKVQERLKKEKQKYDIVVQTDFDFDINDQKKRKQAVYAHSSMNYFKGYMEENYNEIDKPKEKKPEKAKEPAKHKSKTNTISGGGMISSSGKSNKSTQNQQQQQKPANKSNSAVQDYYNNKKINISSLKKIMDDLNSAQSKNDTERVSKVKKDATRKMKSIIADDNTLLRRINGGDPSLKGISPNNLNKTLNTENKILKEFGDLDLSQDKTRATQLLAEFTQLPINL